MGFVKYSEYPVSRFFLSGMSRQSVSDFIDHTNSHGKWVIANLGLIMWSSSSAMRIPTCWR